MLSAATICSRPARPFLTLLASLSIGSPLAVHAQQPGVQGTVEREIMRRQAVAESYSAESILKGATAMNNKDYESAFAYYKSAVDSLPQSPATASERADALDGFSRAAVKLAQQRISEGRFEDAQSTISVVLEDRYNPKYGPALAISQQLRQPDYYNKTITPQFVGRVEEVKQLLLEADGLYQSGRFDLATRRYEQVLNIDPYNIAARRGMERVNQRRMDYTSAARNESRSRMIEKVDSGWALPVPRYDVGASAIVDQPRIDTRATDSIQRKLDSIIIPSIEFNEASVREALDFLKQRAAQLDTSETDPTKKGVNIFLKLDSATAAAESGIRINLSLKEIPLIDALRYIVTAANLKMKVEPYAVAIVPLSEPTDILLTKEYTVPSGFIKNIPTGAATATPGGGGGGVALRTSVRDYLEQQGVTFPPGASANLLPNSSKLIVKTTQENLDLIDLLLESTSESKFTQVEIETKFVEVNQNNLQELGFDWLVGQFALAGGSGVYGSGGTAGTQPGYSSANYPIQNQTGQAIGLNTVNNSGQVTAGNRSGTTAIQANAIDGLLYGGPLGPAAGVLAVAGVFTDPQFQVVIRALNQMKGVDLMSAPRVTAKNAEQARIQIIREFIYPTQFDPPTLPQSAGTAITPITPTTPSEFETKNLGVELFVTPNVGADLTTISMELTPSVTEFDGFINYGSPIDIVAASAIGIALGNTIAYAIGPSATLRASDNTINQPVFSVRKITTNVTIYDGQTVAMGGLISENIQKTEDKTPILGDIPYVGRLFRSSAEQHTKKNLMIFVTAKIIDRAGQPLVKDIENGEEVMIPDATAVANEAVFGDAMSAPAQPIPTR